MDDRLDPRFADAVRAALLAEVRGPGPATASRPPRRRAELVAAGVIAVAAVIAIVLGGVAIARRGAAPAAPEVHAPALPFGGECGPLLSSKEATAIVGEPVGSSRETDERLELAGGLGCTWTSTRIGASITLVAVPEALHPSVPQLPACFSGDAGDGTQWTCPIDVTAGSTWLDGSLIAAPGATAAAARVLAQRVEVALAGRDGHAVLPRRVPGEWRAVDCGAFRTGALAAALGRSGPMVGPAGGGSEVPAAQTAAWRWSRATECVVQQPSSDGHEVFEFQAFPAGAWLEEEAIRDRADPVDSGGTIRILANTTYDDEGPSGRTVWVVDGPDLLRIRSLVPLTDARVRGTVAALLCVLDERSGATAAAH